MEALSIAACIAAAPNSVAGTPESAPIILPIGVLALPSITALESPMLALHHLLHRVEGGVHVCARDLVVGHHPDAAVDVEAVYVPLTQCAYDLVRRPVSCIEEYNVRPDPVWVHVDSCDVRQSVSEAAGVRVVFGQPVDHRLESDDAGGSDDARLTHLAAHDLPLLPGLPL